MWRIPVSILAILFIVVNLTLSLTNVRPSEESIDYNAKDEKLSRIKREEIIDKMEADVFKTFAKNFSLTEADTLSVLGTPCVEVMETCKTNVDCCGDDVICKRKMCRPELWTKIDVID